MAQAVILAGGLGTRLGSLTQRMPKPMLPVAGRPFLDILIAELQRQHVDDIIVVGGFFGQVIADHLRHAPGVEVVIEPSALGTGGALRFVKSRLAPRFFFLNGDSLFDINLQDLAATAGDADATLALRHMPEMARYGPVELAADGTIIGFAERPQHSGPGVINGGVGFMSSTIVAHIPEGMISIERDVYPLLARQGRLRGRVYNRPFIDIGVPEDYALAQTKIPALLKRGAIIFDRDGVLNDDVAYAHRPDQIRWTPGAKDAVKLANDAGLLALVATNQAGIARGYYSEAAMHELHGWMRSELAEAGARIDDIAFCPYHPDGTVEEYRHASPFRKPEPGMLLALMAKHGLTPNRCIMVGDQPTDMAAAAAAGIEGALFTGGDLRSFVAPLVEKLS